MSQALQQQLSELRDDYRNVFSEDFEYFFCPTLFVDVCKPLCLGHICNAGIDGSSNVCVVQRADLDSFYGSVVESTFVAGLAAKTKTPSEILVDPVLSKVLKPKIEADGVLVDYYPDRGHASNQHTKLTWNGNDGDSLVNFVVKSSPDKMEEMLTKKWEIALDVDFIHVTIAALLKSAHLTLFKMLGYGYTKTATCNYLGRCTLGDFFLRYKDKPIAEARLAVRTYFDSFKNLVRPVNMVNDGPRLGTIEDGKVLLCCQSSGGWFAMGVFVRTGQHLACVVVPTDFNTYVGFMSSPPQTLTVQEARFLDADRRWEVSAHPYRVNWGAAHS